MSIQLRPLLLASAITLAMSSLGNANAEDRMSQEIIDARQESQILTTYALSPYLRGNDLRVLVHEGKATLKGNVEEGVDKELAKQIALGVRGVKEVDNQIVVQADYVQPTPASGRSYGEMIDDATITATIKSKLVWSKHADALSTEVDTKAGKVTLSGTADSPAAKELAGRLAMNTHGVWSVDNHLVVTGKQPNVADQAKKSLKEAQREVKDGWITTKVKSTLLYSSNVNGSAVTVHTTNGIVTLSGKLHSGAEQALAIELAQNVRGVKGVHSKDLRH